MQQHGPRSACNAQFSYKTTLPLLNLKFPDELWEFEEGEMGGRSRTQPYYASQLPAALDSAHTLSGRANDTDEATC